MTYELCEELRKAGFPQKAFNNGKNEWLYYEPSLSELIKECGIGLSLVNYDGTFIATSCNNKKLSHERGTGKTPEEALSWLWIALNK